MNFNVIPLKGEKDSYSKKDVRHHFTKWKNDKFYDKPIPLNVNTAMLTGVHPIEKDIQVVVLDFDVVKGHKPDLIHLHSVMDTYNLLPYMVRRTGNGGYHFIYLCDTKVIIRNQHNRKLIEYVQKKFGPDIKDIDVRGEGGLVFWDCKFSDTDEYDTIGYKVERKIDSSVYMRDFINGIRPPPKVRLGYFSGTSLISCDTRTTDVDANINNTNSWKYGIPSDYFHVFNTFRKEIQDIWTGKEIIMKTDNEYKLWGIFWRECLSNGMPYDIIMSRLNSGIQPEFDEDETILQLRCLKYKSKRPSKEYYESVLCRF